MLAWQAARHLAILADEQRLSIVATLAQAGSRGLDIEQLADRLVCDSADLSHPLSKLLAAEFVELQPNGGRYIANAALVEQLTAFLSRRLQPKQEPAVRLVAPTAPKAARGRGRQDHSAHRASGKRETAAETGKMPRVSLAKRLEEAAPATSVILASVPRPLLPPAHIQAAFRRQDGGDAHSDAATRKALARRSIALIGLAEELAEQDAKEPCLLQSRPAGRPDEPQIITEQFADTPRSSEREMLFRVPKSPNGATLSFERTSSSPYALERPVVVVRLPTLERAFAPVAPPPEPPRGRDGRPRKLTEALAAANFERHH